MQRSCWRRTAVLPVALVASVLAPTVAVAQQDSTLAQGLALYRQNRLSEALPILERAAVERPHDGERLGWLAETLRRTGATDRAVAVARSAVVASACNVVAEDVLGVSYSSLYTTWGQVNDDSGWVHLQRAVQCDSTDGNAWLWLVFEGMRRSDRQTEEHALRRLIEVQFFSPATVAYTRWVLQLLPRNAVLLTDGDLDTYPALALQLTEGLRPDVAVVARQVLEWPFYVRVVDQRLRVPVIAENIGASAILSWWRTETADGRLARPLVTFDSTTFPAGRGSFGLLGPFVMLRPDSAAAGPADTAALHRAFVLARGSDFAGPEVSSADRSPVRTSSAEQRGLTSRVLLAGSRYGQALLDAGRLPEAQDVLRKMRSFASDAGLSAAETPRDLLVFSDEVTLRRVRDSLAHSGATEVACDTGGNGSGPWRVECAQLSSAWMGMGSAASYSRRHGMLVMWGGEQTRGTRFADVTEVRLATGTFAAGATVGTPPSTPFIPSLAIDERRDVLYVFGGWFHDARQGSDTLYSIDLTQTPYHWKRLPHSGAWPPGRNGAAMIYVSTCDCLLLQGGDAGGGASGFTPLADQWRYDLGTGVWSTIPTHGDAPPPRWNHMMAVDAQKHRAFLFGGAGPARDPPDSSLYELDLGSFKWRRVTTNGNAPPAVEGASLTFDDSAGVLLLVGGLRLAGAGAATLSDVWVFDPKTRSWSHSDGGELVRRRDHIGMYDPVTNAHYLIGGRVSNTVGRFGESAREPWSVVRIRVHHVSGHDHPTH